MHIATLHSETRLGITTSLFRMQEPMTQAAKKQKTIDEACHNKTHEKRHLWTWLIKLNINYKWISLQLSSIMFFGLQFTSIIWWFFDSVRWRRALQVMCQTRRQFYRHRVRACLTHMAWHALTLLVPHWPNKICMIKHQIIAVPCTLDQYIMCIIFCGAD